MVQVPGLQQIGKHLRGRCGETIGSQWEWAEKRLRAFNVGKDR